MATKTCTKCRHEKPISEYQVRSRSKDGFHFQCYPCMRAARLARSEKERAARLVKYAANREEKLAKQRAYQAANREIYREACAKWRAENPEKQRAASKRWELLNGDKTAAAAARYNASKRRRTPNWLTKEQRDHIFLFYVVSRQLSVSTGVRHHVDHIVPLRGDRVCGLHVPWNLQILTAADNIRKFNHPDRTVQPVLEMPK